EDGIEPTGDGEGHRWAPRRAGSAGGGLVFALEAPLALDAVSRERQGIEALLSDRLAAPLPPPEAPLRALPGPRHHPPQEPPVPVAELELELSGVRRIGLVAEILGRVLVEALLVDRTATHFGLELTALGHERLTQLLQPLLGQLGCHRHRPPPPRR